MLTLIIRLEISLLSVRRTLAEAEKLESLQGSVSAENISAAHWLAVGIELEDLQYVQIATVYNGTPDF